MSTKNVLAPFPQLSPKCRIFYRDKSDEYMANSYQYATSSNKCFTMKPAAVIYPENLQDIIAMVNYAKECNLGIAVRTGGHQYSGQSSTSGENIQLDISDTFQSEEEDFYYDEASNLLRVGVSFSLHEMNTLIGKREIFVPTGQCVHVHLGGHVQTGGYGQLNRSFGLLSDYVEGFDIVLASGDHKTIWRPDSPQKEPEMKSEESSLNDDLYWAVLGGSPGNWGILTHVWLRPLKDKDYPHSRGMKLFTMYTKEKLERILNVVAEMNDDEDLPRDYDICITMMTDAVSSFPLRGLFSWKPKKYKNIDERIMYEFPEQYADGVEWAEKGKMSIPIIPVPCILIYLQWANVNGSSEKFGDEQKVWFDKVREAAKPSIVDDAFGTCFDGVLSPMRNFFKSVMGDSDVRNWLYVCEDKHTPMSKLCRYWSYEDIREFCKPYEKRTYFSNKTDLRTNGWSAWTSQRTHEIADGEDREMDIVLQIQPVGGKNSMYLKNGNPDLHHGSHSWRNETTLLQTMDCFYQPESDDDRSDERLNKALQWTFDNDVCVQNGVVSKVDRRFFWSSYSRLDDPDCGSNLHSVRGRYYDSEEKYQRLVEIKRRVDPEYIFTANMFGIDANNAPKNRQLLVIARGHVLGAGSANILRVISRDSTESEESLGHEQQNNNCCEIL